MYIPASYNKGKKGYRTTTSSSKRCLRTVIASHPVLADQEVEQALLLIREDVKVISSARQQASLVLQAALSSPSFSPPLHLRDVTDALRLVTGRPAAAGCPPEVSAAWAALQRHTCRPVQVTSSRQFDLLLDQAKRMVSNFRANMDKALESTAKRVEKLVTAAAGLQGHELPPAVTAIMDKLSAGKLHRQAGTAAKESPHQHGQAQVHDFAALRAFIAAAAAASDFCMTKRAKQPTVPLFFPQRDSGPQHVTYSADALARVLLSVVGADRRQGLDGNPLSSVKTRPMYNKLSLQTDGASASILLLRHEHVEVKTGNLDRLHLPRKARRAGFRTAPFSLSWRTAGGITTAEQLAEAISAQKTLAAAILQAHFVAVDPGRLKLVHAVGLGKLGDAAELFTVEGTTSGRIPQAQDHLEVSGDARSRANEAHAHRLAVWRERCGAGAAHTALSTAPPLRRFDHAEVLAAAAQRALLLQHAALDVYYHGGSAYFSRQRWKHEIDGQRHTAHVVRQLCHTAKHGRPREFKPPTQLAISRYTCSLINRMAAHKYRSAADRAAERRRLRRMRRRARRRLGKANVQAAAERRTARRHWKAVTAHPDPTVVAFGDYSWAQMKGVSPSSHTPYIMACARRPGTVVVVVDEYLTSKTCWRCTARCTFDDRRAVCPNCRAHRETDRDAQGAVNIGKLAALMVRDGVRPLPFLRPRRRNRKYDEQVQQIAKVRTLRLAHQLLAAGCTMEETVVEALKNVEDITSQYESTFIQDNTRTQVGLVYGRRILPPLARKRKASGEQSEAGRVSAETHILRLPRRLLGPACS